jgi:prevent-host-death family protein
MDDCSHTVSAFDAKNRLGRMLDRVEAGEMLVITRHGEPVARLMPMEKQADDAPDQALATFKAIRTSIARSAAGKSKTTVEQKTIRLWKLEGRR